MLDFSISSVNMAILVSNLFIIFLNVSLKFYPFFSCVISYKSF